MPEIPRIQIKQTYAKVGIETKKASIEIEQPKADLDIRQEHAKIEIKSTKPKLTIDQSEAWSALGRRPSLEFTKVIADGVRQVNLDYISKVNEAGDRMAQIHIESDAIPELAANNKIKFTEFYYEAMPSTDNVKISVVPGELEINYQDGKVINETKTNRPKVSYNPGDIRFYLREKNSIEIIPPQIDMKL